MKLPLEGGTVLVTGASSGIGRELARELARKAKAIVLVARREQRLQEVAVELKARHPNLNVHVMPCDISDLGAIDQLLREVKSEVGPIDVLINSAGTTNLMFLERVSFDDIERMIQLNVTALTYLIRQLLPSMITRGRGGILNVSSFFGLTILPGVAAYAGTKHYVTALTKALRAETAGTGVVVSQVCPGPVKTELWEKFPNQTGMDFPRFLFISAKQCARAAVRGFSRGRAVIVPARRIRLQLFMIRLMPEALSRFIWSRVARMMRKQSVADAQLSLQREK